MVPMLEILVFFAGVMPLVIGLYAWRLLRGRDQDASDDPPPPPEPPPPRPITPPSSRMPDRLPARQQRVRTSPWPTHRVRTR